MSVEQLKVSVTMIGRRVGHIESKLAEIDNKLDVITAAVVALSPAPIPVSTPMPTPTLSSHTPTPIFESTYGSIPK